jgi:hypothetical protein
MLGRKDYTQEELDNAKASVARQLAAYRSLATAAAANGDGDRDGDGEVESALDHFEVPFFNNMVLALDRPFVHRLRVTTGKDGNPLNEVELLVESLINNGGVLRGNNVIKFVPDQSVLKLQIGDRIRVTADDFERLSDAFFAELERKFR